MKRTSRLLTFSLLAQLPGCMMAQPASESVSLTEAHTAQVHTTGVDESEGLASVEASPPPMEAQESERKPDEAARERPAKMLEARKTDEARSLADLRAGPKDSMPMGAGLARPLTIASPDVASRGKKEAGERRHAFAPPPPAPRPEPAKPSDDRDSDGDGATQDGGEFVSAGINDLIDPNADPLSTFAADVDTGSYSLARRYLIAGGLPPQAGVRVEEWVNAFGYSYPDQAKEHPFSIHVEGAPLSKNSQLVRIGIQGKRIEKAQREPAHLTFLVDVSGSMSGSDRLPLAKQALSMLVSELDARDSVSLVTYAGSTGVVLAATPVSDKNRQKIFTAINALGAGGGTAMGSGMELAYREATKALGDKGSSRVIVLSDGDANIGRTGFREILGSIKGYVSEGVTMSTVGFGTGNYRDHLMEQLADAGNGNYSYVGSMSDAKKIFVDNLTGTLQVIAKDTKIQVEMNPAVVEKYRLVGYENRDVHDEDFRNDKVDAGEIGAGHTVTALYEVILKEEATAGNLATIRVRYKTPRGTKATEVASTFTAQELKRDLRSLSSDGRFAVGVGLAAESMRNSPHMARLGLTLADAHALMSSALEGPHAAERREISALIGPLAGGVGVASR